MLNNKFRNFNTPLIIGRRKTSRNRADWLAHTDARISAGKRMTEHGFRFRYYWILKSPASQICLVVQSPASFGRITCLLPKMRVLREGVLARSDWQLLCDKLAISNTFSYAKNRNDLRTITLSKVPFPEVGFPPSPSWEAGDCSHLPPMAHRDRDKPYSAS